MSGEAGQAVFTASRNSLAVETGAAYRIHMTQRKIPQRNYYYSNTSFLLLAN
jgi:hypothetical protein